MERDDGGRDPGANRRRSTRCVLDGGVRLHLGPRTLDAVLIDLGTGGLRLACPSLQLSESILLQVYLARSDDRGVVAWGQVIRADGHGIAIGFARVEPDGQLLLTDLSAWARHPITAIYLSPAAAPNGRTWWTTDVG